MWNHPARLLAAVFCVFATQTLFLILLPLSLVEAGHAPGVALGLVSLLGLMGVLADIPIGAVSDKHGRVVMVIAGGLCTCGSGLVLGAGGGQLVPSVAGVVLYSLGLSMTFAPLLAMLTEATPSDRQPRLQGLNGATQGVATVAGAAAAGLLAQTDPRSALYAMAVLGLGIAFAVIGIHERRGATAPSAMATTVVGSFRPTLRLTSRAGVRAAMLISGLYAVGFLVVGGSLLPLVLVETSAFEPWAMGLLIAGRNLVAAGVSLTFPRAVKRIGLRRSVLLSQCAAIGGIVVLAPALWMPWALPVSLLLQGLGASFGAAAANTYVAGATDTSERGAGLAVTTVASRIALLMGPVVLSVLIGWSGNVVALLSTALLACLGLAGLALVTKSEHVGSRDRRRA